VSKQFDISKLQQGQWIDDKNFVVLITHKEEIDQYINEKLSKENKEELYQYVSRKLTDAVLEVGFWDILETLVKDKVRELNENG